MSIEIQEVIDLLELAQLNRMNPRDSGYESRWKQACRTANLVGLTESIKAFGAACAQEALGCYE